MGGDRKVVEVVSSKGCAAMLTEAASSFRKSNIDGLQHFPGSEHELEGPFSGLVICVTGLSKEARKQVKDATEKLGGVYCPILHPQCTHLVLQSTSGLKLDQPVKLASSAKGSLSVVTIGWFVDSVRRKVRLSEDLYRINHTARSIKRFADYTGSESPCISVISKGNARHFRRQDQSPKRITSDSILSGKSIYIDPDISLVEQNKVMEAGSREGMTFLKKWGAGCDADFVVCDATSVKRYLGQCRSSDLVTSAWILKTVMHSKMRRLVHISDDLAKQVHAMLKLSQEENSKKTSSPTVLRESPSSLLDSVCWNKSEPATSPSIDADSFDSDLNGNSKLERNLKF